MRRPAASDCISIDIGSTFTKGGRFRLISPGEDEAEPGIVCRTERPTNRSDLAVSFTEVLHELARDDKEELPVHVSSSAKGGLAVAAAGIVPDLTLKAARLTACSAGAKIIKTYAYKLTREETAGLASLQPDIILLTGGTDGGDEDHVLHNAAVLTDSEINAVILYAGNAKAAARVERILSGKRVQTVPNVLPELTRLNPGPAGEAIRRIFLREIIQGKGLGAVQAKAAGPVKPTPLAVFELVQTMTEDESWTDTIIVDAGGATTDCYSNSEVLGTETAPVTCRGLPEPRIKRTVEGDLGVRISLPSLYAAEGNRIGRLAAQKGITPGETAAYIGAVSSDPRRLPATEKEAELDRIFASVCAAAAVLRHGGTMRAVYGPLGQQFVQTGKDLRRAKRIIVSGGVLSRGGSLRDLLEGSWETGEVSGSESGTGAVPLIPRNFDLYRDSGYMLPLIANLAEPYPGAVKKLLKKGLTKEDTVRCV